MEQLLKHVNKKVEERKTCPNGAYRLNKFKVINEWQYCCSLLFLNIWVMYSILMITLHFCKNKQAQSIIITGLCHRTKLEGLQNFSSSSIREGVSIVKRSLTVNC
jgi:hypothetical protein